MKSPENIKQTTPITSEGKTRPSVELPALPVPILSGNSPKKSIGMRKTIYLLALLSAVILSDQSHVKAVDPNGLNRADTINKIDRKHSKQGYWVHYGIDKNITGYGPDQRVEEGNYRDNRKTGIWIGYFPNGSIRNIITYKKGQPRGFAKQYYANGHLREEGLWEHNKWVGEYKFYHENGKRCYEFNFSMRGNRTGVQKYYYDNGQLMIEGEWTKGKENNKVISYNENGLLQRIAVYRNGNYIEDAIIEELKTN